MSAEFFGDWELNKWWKRKLAKLGYKSKDYHFGFKVGHCAICGNEDYVFPSGELKLCDKCYRRVKDNGAEIVSDKVVLDLNGDYCDVCGSRIYKYHKVQTYICNKCTRKIGKKAKENNEKRMYGARKIA